jgi:exopolyphosphatase/guanosine-5'-triphosphate,3'-diphosphate pyrophosphatase
MCPDSPGAVAALDCGTNSTRLLVVGPDGTALERRMRITRLGEGVDASHTLSSAAIARTVEVLSDYRRLMDHHRVDRARLVATSAARDATNAQEFLSAAQLAVGVQPELLTGLEEGALSFAGATARLPPDRAGKGPVLVVDVGGGSTELVAGYPAAVDRTGTSVAVASMDVGCVRVTERFLHHDPPLADELHYDRDRIHHFVLTEAMVDTWLDRLAGENSRARAARKGMVEGRADVIMGGTVVLQAVMAVFDRSECLVSEDDILDGLAASLT